VKEPWLFVATPSQVLARLARLADIWQLEQPALLTLVLQHPQLLTMSRETIAAKLTSVAQVCQCARVCACVRERLCACVRVCVSVCFRCLGAYAPVCVRACLCFYKHMRMHARFVHFLF